MADTYINSTKPIKQGDSYYYPPTTAKQVILPDGRRLGSAEKLNLHVDDVDGALSIDLTDAVVGEATLINSDLLGGRAASEYVTNDMLDGYATRGMLDNYATRGMLDNYATTEMLPNEKRIVISVPSAQWIQQEDGSYTQTIAVDGFTAYTKCNFAELDTSMVTIDNYEEIQEAWSKVFKMDTVSGGIMLTAYSGMPEIDFNIIVEVAG